MIRIPHIPFAYKLAAAVSVVILVSMLILSTSVINRQHALLEQQFHHSGMTTVRQLADSSVELLFTDDLLGLESLTNKLNQLEGIVGTAIYDEAGQVQVSVGLAAPSNTFQRYKALQPGGWQHELAWPSISQRSSNLVSFVYPIQFQQIVGGHALVTFSRIDIDQAKNEALWSLLGLAVLFSVLVVIAIILVSRHFARPVSELVEATRAIAQEKYDVRIAGKHSGDMGHLVESFNQMAEGLQQKLQVESVFSRFVSGQVATKFMSNLDQVQLGGKRVNASVLFVDIVGFTSISEQTSPEKVALLLNEYFGYFAFAANYYNGIVDKFIGDAGMMVFGVPQYDPDHEFHAVATAVLIQNVIERTNQARINSGQKPIQVRMGISSGTMLAGILGSQDRMQYTVVGDSVNLASRLCDLGFPGQIVVDQEFYQRANKRGQLKGNTFRTVSVKGKSDAIETMIITGLKDDLKTAIESATDQMLVANK